MNKFMVFLMISFLLSSRVGAVQNGGDNTGRHAGYFKIGPDGNKKFIRFANSAPKPAVKKIEPEYDSNTVLGQLVRHLTVALFVQQLTVDDLFIKTDSQD